MAAYDEAFAVVPDPVYLNNKATALYEAGDFDQSISVSEKAVDEGREQRADYKVIAKCATLAARPRERTVLT